MDRGAFGFVEEPEGDGQGDGEEHVGSGCHDDINRPVFDEFAADLHLGATGIRCRVRHDEPGSAGVVEC